MQKTCPYCGTELTENASGETPTICPTCGQGVNESADGAAQPTSQSTPLEPGPVEPQKAAEPVLTENSPAWEKSGNIFVRLSKTIWQVLLHPVRTFSAPGRPGIKWPLGYAVIMGTFTAVGGYLLNEGLLGIKRAGPDPTAQQIFFLDDGILPNRWSFVSYFCGGRHSPRASHFIA